MRRRTEIQTTYEDAYTALAVLALDQTNFGHIANSPVGVVDCNVDFCSVSNG